MELGKRIKQCRMCDSENLYEFLDLGYAPPSDFILTKEELEKPETLFPLKVAQCKECGLTQLTYAVNPLLLYGENYKYESSITETGKNHFFSMADSIAKRFNLGEGDLAIDIGSNVGVLLEGFKKNGLNVLGIDPAPFIVEIANKRGIETWKGLMDIDIASKIKEEKGEAKVISTTNVFAHVEDKASLMESIKLLLHKDGVFIIEAPYLVDLLENVEYDTIYLEHLEYLSLKPLIKFFKKYKMDVFDICRTEIHGKSIRVFVCNEGCMPIEENVQKLLELEENKKIYSEETLRKFEKNVKKNKRDFSNMLIELKNQGKRIVGISAPAKGNTLLNYCKIDADTLDYITEKSIIKLNHFTPGMHIPIVKEEKLKIDKPDYGIIFAWNFAKEIIENNKDFLDRGGKFIIPIPFPRIYVNDLD